jgi:thiosulfate/3-mercaptopyruvate sulfurtransferase
MFTTLISAADLAPRVDDPDWLIVDCRFDLARPEAGETAYRTSHIPRAVYAHLDRDLSSPVTPTTGRHPLPAPEQFASTLGRWGLTHRTQVVAYDADTGAYAARLWWLLRWAEHRAVAVLDGGFKSWVGAGLPVSAHIDARTATRVDLQVNDALWLRTEQVAERIARTDWRLLDARAPERFAGAVEPIDTVAGHVPGARNHPFATGLGADGRFLESAELRRRLAASQDGVTDEQTIAMCGSGVTACHLLLAMEVAGKTGAKLYAGSWSEWIRDPQRGIARG